MTALVDARQSFRALPSAGLIGLDQFDAGAAVLSRLDLLSPNGETLVVDPKVATLAALEESAALRLLLEALLLRRPPGWLRNATATRVVRQDLIPDGERGVVESVFTDPSLREMFLLQAGRRVNSRRLDELGAIGELHALELCRMQLEQLGRPDLAAAAARVSQISDQLGYDLTVPALDGSDRRLEVKATRRAGWQAEVYLSRNEFEQGKLDPAWWLVVVEIDADDAPSLLGHCRADALEAMVPSDRHEHGKWVSVRLQQIAPLLQAGLPPA